MHDQQRKQELEKLVESLANDERLVNANSLEISQRIGECARTVLGYDPGREIITLNEQAQNDVLMVMRGLRDALFVRPQQGSGL